MIMVNQWFKVEPGLKVISAQTSETVLTSREMLLPEKSSICISVVYSDFLKSDPDWKGLVVRFQKQ